METEILPPDLRSIAQLFTGDVRYIIKKNWGSGFGNSVFSFPPLE
jgi:hypothetical protein